MSDSLYVIDGYIPQGYFTYTANAQAQNIVASSTMSVSAVTIKSPSVTLAGAFTPSLSANRTTGLATDNPDWDYPSATWDTWYKEIWGYEGKTLYANTELSVITGKYLGIVRQLDVTTSLGTQNLIVGHTEQAQSTQNSVSTTAVTSVVRERRVAKTLDTSVSMAVAGVVQRSIAKTLDTTTLVTRAQWEAGESSQMSVTVTAAIEGIRAALGQSSPAVETTLSAQWEAGESATLAVLSDLRIVVTGEAQQFSEFGISVSAARIRSSSSTQPATVELFAEWEAGESAVLSAVTDADTLGGKLAGGSTTMLGFATTLTIGRVLSLDPYYQLRVDQEVRDILVQPETGMLVVDDEQRQIRVIEEQRIIDVEQETRRFHIPVPPYNQNKERVG